MKPVPTLLILLVLLACPRIALTQKSLRDRDGNVYKTFELEGKTWMAENLNVAHYRNGDAIPEAKNVAEWDRFAESRTGCWCYYDFKASNGRIYGKLYNWYAVNDRRGLAPAGWHVPEDTEWLIFTQYFGYAERPGKLLKNQTGWSDGFMDCSGLNVIGFCGLPGGSREISVFFGIGEVGHWWCTNESEVNFARTRGLACNSDDLWLNNTLKQCGCSVRCVKN